jgi:hypothetical protein
MYHRFLPLASITLLIGGCTTSPPSSSKAVEILGQQTTWVLQMPTRIEGWDFRGPGGAVYNEPPTRQLDLSIASELRDILLDDSTYAKTGGSGGFVREVGFRVWRGEQSVDVLMSPSSDLMIIKSPAYGGQSSSSLSTSAANAHQRVERLAKKAFH